MHEDDENWNYEYDYSLYLGPNKELFDFNTIDELKEEIKRLDLNIYIGPDVIIGNYSHINYGARIENNVHIGSGVYIGERAFINENIHILKNAKIYGGARLDNMINVYTPHPNIYLSAYQMDGLYMIQISETTQSIEQWEDYFIDVLNNKEIVSNPITRDILKTKYRYFKQIKEMTIIKGQTNER